jgi:hypothetical protein
MVWLLLVYYMKVAISGKGGQNDQKNDINRSDNCVDGNIEFHPGAAPTPVLEPG